MANQLLQFGQIDRARALYLQEFSANPQDISAIEAAVKLCRKHQQTDLAITLLESANKLLPDNVSMLNMLADILRERGRNEESRKLLRHSLQLKPGQVRVLTALSANTPYTEYSDELQTLEQLHSNAGNSQDDQRRIAFALGKAFDELGQFEKAFEFFLEGNQLAKDSYPYSIENERRNFELIKSVFSEDFFHRHQNSGISEKTPIFITGMPRSGTTLIEQILSSHPMVYGGGELQNLRNIVRNTEEMIGRPFPAGFDALKAEALRDMAYKYVFSLKRLVSAEVRVTDKSLLTNFHIGLIAAMLPDAKIIHCSRDPRDSGLSFFQIFFGAEQPHSYDLRIIGEYQKLYLDLLNYWKNLLPGKIYDIGYEDVAGNPEKNIRELLSYCELEYDPACLIFHETDRAVRTASSSQVRKPIYATSIGRWKNYEKQLQPLIEALES